MVIETLTREGLGTWLEKGISNVAFLSLGLRLDNIASRAFTEAKVSRLGVSVLQCDVCYYCRDPTCLLWKTMRGRRRRRTRRMRRRVTVALMTHRTQSRELLTPVTAVCYIAHVVPVYLSSAVSL